MAEQNFVDYVKICCRSGAGGSGASHFHRDKTTASGGPDGGDGGRGGHIILRGNSNEWTLLSLKYKKHINAGNGVPGAGGMKNGAFGHDVYLEVPLGTVARDAETGEIEFEITTHGEEKILVPGGRGGLGNAHFKSSTNQSPEYAQKGDSGLEEWKILELKVLADVGLVGFPNAGKSSLLAAMTAAKPEIANYPFTTLVPNLGIVRYRDSGSYIMADIPGIIEEAHQGRGLGLRFLRHIERNSMLLFMIPTDTEDINKAYQILLYELKMYNPDLLEKPRLLAISKNDLIDEEIQQWIEKDLKVDIPYLFISAVAEKGLTELNDAIWRMLHEG